MTKKSKQPSRPTGSVLAGGAVLKKLADFFFEVGTLRKLARSHRQTLLTDDLSDNIASHSYRVVMIGWFLANLEKTDPYKVVTMCLFHDTGEARSGDQNWVHKKFVKIFEDEIHDGQLKNLPFNDELSSVSLEYQERKSKAALIAKDADLLDQILLLKEYSWVGNKEAAMWLKSKSGHYSLLKTKSARQIAEKILSSNPSDWWNDLWTPHRR